jgi:hypothetical protein
MKTVSAYATPALLGLILLSGCGDGTLVTESLYRAPPLPNPVDGVVYEAGNWEPHLQAGEEGVSWGNHRAVVVVDDPTVEAVQVTIPWRRHDPDPGSKGIVVVDAASGEPVENSLALRVESVSGDVVFQPNPGSTTYHLYYLPWQSTGGYYPTMSYPTSAEMRDPTGLGAQRGEVSRAEAGGETSLSWAGKVSVNDPAWESQILSSQRDSHPTATVTHIQSVTDFHSFFPMEVIASPEEEEAFMDGAPEGWAVVPEHRDFPVRMREFIPRHWATEELATRMPELTGASADGGPTSSGESASAQRGPSAATQPWFASRVLKDEAFTFQLALISGEGALSDIEMEFDNFPRTFRDAFTCFSCQGTNEKGEAFSKEISVPAGAVQPLWIGLQIPAGQPAGLVEGTITISTSDRGTRSVKVALEVGAASALNHGHNEPDLQSRLAWLNSTVGTDPDFIIRPFEPVRIEDPTEANPSSLSVLGRRIDLEPSGLPRQIYSFFTPELTELSETPDPILSRPMSLEVTAGDQELLEFQASPFEIVQEALGVATWTVESTSTALEMTVRGRLEYDGMLDYGITLVAKDDLDVQNIAFPIEFQPDAAEYMLGLGRKGGRRPTSVDWTWAVENHQEGVWLGGIHKGLQYVLRDENYIRPLNTNFYRNQPLNMPPSWFNEGRGGIRIRETEGSVLADNYSGARTLSAGDTLHFNVRFLITPFKPIDTGAHFNTRFVHQYVPVDSVKEWGGTVVNIHHANEINPYINYPFFAQEELASYIDEAHEKGIKVKLYNTIRELTYKAHELFAMRSFGDEILNDGEGGGHSWMQEHLQDRYHSAWHAARTDDAAMLNKGTSRWTNYYVEGISWLAEHQHIDGLYLDDIAFSRETVKRIVTVLDEHRDEVVIDLHSANQFNVRDGFTNSAMLYMEHFPFITRLWFGEYFEYDLDEDYWMTEVSGLPFGLMGEMLQDGGHPYRGMLYGMTARKYGNVDPRPVWGMMNDFGIAESRMLGYWLEDTPARTDHPRVLATTYSRPEGALIALASWSDEDEVVKLELDWGALGLGGEMGAERPQSLRVYTPEVDGLQAEADVDLSAVRVPAGMGLWVIVEG